MVVLCRCVAKRCLLTHSLIYPLLIHSPIQPVFGWLAFLLQASHSLQGAKTIFLLRLVQSELVHPVSIWLTGIATEYAFHHLGYKNCISLTPCFAELIVHWVTHSLTHSLSQSLTTLLIHFDHGGHLWTVSSIVYSLQCLILSWKTLSTTTTS